MTVLGGVYALFVVVKELLIRGNGKETCANCNGKGQFKCGYCKNGERICTCCNGTGKQRHVGR